MGSSKLGAVLHVVGHDRVSLSRGSLSKPARVTAKEGKMTIDPAIISILLSLIAVACAIWMWKGEDK